MLGIEDYNILEASPELSGSMASGLLKNKAMHTFFALNGHIMGSYYHGPNHPCNSENIVADFWKEFTWLLVFLRESGLRGLEPLSQEYIDMCDLSVRKQRVWLGVIAPDDSVLFGNWHAWIHTLYFHIMYFVRKYGGIGSLDQECVEVSHKEVHKDLAAFTVGGTRLASQADWIRIMYGYNIDLVTLRDLGLLRNGGDLGHYLCECVSGGTTCRKCIQMDPRLLLLQ